MKTLPLLFLLLLQDADVPRLVEDLRAADVARRADAERDLGLLLARKGGDVAVFKTLKDLHAKEQDPEARIRLTNLLAPWQRDGVAWQRDLGAPIDQVVECNEAKDRIVLLTRHKVAAGCYPCQLHLVCISAKTGEVRWVAKEPFGQNPANGVVAGDRYIATNSMVLNCFDLATGARSWSVATRHSFGIPAVEDGRIYIGGYAWFTCFDLEGKEQWHHKARAWMGGPFFTGGKLITGSAAAGVVCLDRKDGSVAWTRDLKATPLFFDGDRVICHGDAVHACNVADGSSVWTWTPDKGDRSTDVRLQAGQFFVTTAKFRAPADERRSRLESYDHRVHGLDAKTGALLWTKVPEEIPLVTAAPGPRAFGLEFRHEPAELGVATRGCVLKAHRLKAIDEN